MNTLRIQQIPSAARKGRSVLLKIEGEMVVSNTEPLRQLLADLLPDAKSVRIVLQEVESLDLAFVQLLWSARKTAAALDKNFTVEGTLPGEIMALLKSAGFEKLPQYGHQA
jgi:anti-anti-sigma regulatory factor